MLSIEGYIFTLSHTDAETDKICVEANGNQY